MTALTGTPADGAGEWTPVFRAAGPGRAPHAYDVTNLHYPNGACGQVQRDPRGWRITADVRPGGHWVYPTRISAARAECDLIARHPEPGAAPSLAAWLGQHGLLIATRAGGRPVGDRRAAVIGRAWLMAGGWRDIPLTWPEDPTGWGTKDPRPTIISLHPARSGATIGQRSDERITFVRYEAGEDADVWYEGTVPQSDLFRVLLAAGLLRRRVHAW